MIDEPTPFLPIAYSQEEQKFLNDMEQVAREIMTTFAIPPDLVGEVTTNSNLPTLLEHVERIWPLTCYKLDELGMWDISGCCSSCHEDDELEEMSYPLSEYTLPDGREIRVCCRCKPWDAKTQKDLELS